MLHAWVPCCLSTSGLRQYVFSHVSLCVCKCVRVCVCVCQLLLAGFYGSIWESTQILSTHTKDIHASWEMITCVCFCDIVSFVSAANYPHTHPTWGWYNHYIIIVAFPFSSCFIQISLYLSHIMHTPSCMSPHHHHHLPGAPALLTGFTGKRRGKCKNQSKVAHSQWEGKPDSEGKQEERQKKKEEEDEEGGRKRTKMEKRLNKT